MSVPFTADELHALLGRPVRQVLTAADRRAFRKARAVALRGLGAASILPLSCVFVA